MISIVICSRTLSIDKILLNNIASTIGADIAYELLVIDNFDNSHSIFSAYNEGVAKAKYPIVCFMHEDILFGSENWGQEVINCFNNAKVGLCGVIGSKYVSNSPLGWWFCHSRRGYVTENRNGDEVVVDYGRKNLENVITVDGLWFCIRKSLFSTISFDDGLFKGFHCYDMDISLQIFSKGYELQLLSNIDLYHKSQGCVNDDFYFNCTLLYKKWKKLLPISVDIDKNELIKNKNFVQNSIQGVSKNIFFNWYVHSLPFICLCLFEKISNRNINSLFHWIYKKEFILYCKIASLKNLNHE